MGSVVKDQFNEKNYHMDIEIVIAGKTPEFELGESDVNQSQLSKKLSKKKKPLM